MASQKRKILFIDRDGTLIMEPEDQQIDAFEKLVFYPEVITYLGKIARELDYLLVMVTNQDGLGTPSHPEANFWPVHNLMMATLESEGITFEEVIIDRTYASENAPTRKPGTALLTHYMNDAIDLANSFVIGDRKTDVELAKNLSCRAIWINNQGLGDEEVNAAEDTLEKATALKTARWKEIYEFLKLEDRTAQLERNTRETRIKISLNLDGAGHSEISTGLAFFDHMLDQLARHGQLDLKIHTEGDLHVDEHHTIEDTAIALGEVFALALGNKLGIERYGYQLPMDDSLASVSLDFGGRSWLVWETSFQREKIGDMPTEMFYHFFKSFADGARANLNIQAKGTNEHHKIEAVFKAFAKAIKMAVRRDPEHMILPSTKGML